MGNRKDGQCSYVIMFIFFNNEGTMLIDCDRRFVTFGVEGGAAKLNAY